MFRVSWNKWILHALTEIKVTAAAGAISRFCVGIEGVRCEDVMSLR